MAKRLRIEIELHNRPGVAAAMVGIGDPVALTENVRGGIAEAAYGEAEASSPAEAVRRAIERALSIYELPAPIPAPPAPPPPPVDRTNTIDDATGQPRTGHPRENEPAPGELKENGQHSSYWVLSPEERAKGFVRPVRRSYVHKGKRPKHPTRPLTEEEQERFDGCDFVAFETYPEGERSRGRYWTQAELDSGCGTATTMSQAIAETYARDPGYYGQTMCVHCGTHFPVAEFVWDDGSVLGS